MKKLVLTLAAVLALAAPAAFAAEHGGHAGHDMAGMAKMEGVAYEAVIDGVKTTFTVQTMKEAMAAMGMKMPAGVKDTHHISVTFKDPKSGKALTGGEVKVKLLSPDKSEQVKDLMGMHGHFGGDFVMTQKGKYGVMAKFKLADGKVRSAKFWYSVN